LTFCPIPPNSIIYFYFYLILHPSHNYCLFKIFSFSQNNCHFTISMQHLLVIFSTYYTLIYWISFNLTTIVTTINKGILVNAINFIIQINTINHFLNNRAQTLNDYYYETEGVIVTGVIQMIIDSFGVPTLWWSF